jgi:hypothetical protein
MSSTIKQSIFALTGLALIATPLSIHAVQSQHARPVATMAASAAKSSAVPAEHVYFISNVT